MRKSKHNMFKKVETLVQAIQDKGSVDMDTHELSNLVKDTLTKRRAKIFYVDVFSSVIGEPDKEAPTFACNKINADGEIIPSTWTLGSEVICNTGENSGHFDPYIVFLTDEQKSKLQITVSSTVDEMPADDLSGEFQIFPIQPDMDDAISIGKPADCHYWFYGYLLGALSSQLEAMLERQLRPDEHVKITITYDGVDYAYQS